MPTFRLTHDRSSLPTTPVPPAKAHHLGTGILPSAGPGAFRGGFEGRRGEPEGEPWNHGSPSDLPTTVNVPKPPNVSLALIHSSLLREGGQYVGPG